MTEILTTLIALSSIAFAAWSQRQVREQTEDLLALERQRTLEWWARSQAHIDNLQDRVMTKEFETYAQASYVEKPSDQPQFSAEGEFNAGGMATSLLEQLRHTQTDSPYPEDVPDLAEDYAGPIIG